MRTLVILLTALLLACCAGDRARAQGTSTKPVTVQGSPDIQPLDCTTPATQKIAIGGTAQTLFTASKVIHGFILQNVDTTEPLCLSFTGTPTCGNPGTFVLQPGTASTYAGAGSFSAPLGLGVNLAPQVVAATSNHAYACIKW